MQTIGCEDPTFKLMQNQNMYPRSSLHCVRQREALIIAACLAFWRKDMEGCVLYNVVCCGIGGTP